ncbi:hypothetical protein QYE76_036530 [Lolium multiflorum]|uniref:Gag-pol polyprotein n=1 Tax=Lolium multiflorum TaxID=4521 RepID=A0AAD8VM67_LOLMU|nr:hypothetical protein QYE76_036530 [Lolium multiflorum]
MGKPRDSKVAILPSTTRKGTILSTSATLDSPSVIDKLVSPPHASHAGTSAESENSHNIDNISAVLDDSGSLGSFLDATIARSRQIGNAETPNENATTHVNSPELDYFSDDPDEDYVELNDDFIEKCNATTDARKIKKLLAEHAVRYKLSPDPKFATSPINIKDKDYDFSLDLSHIAIVEKTPFCGEEETSSTRYVSTRAREKLAKIFNDISFESSADSYISDGSSDVDSYDFIDKSITVGKVFINLNDDVTKPNIDLNTKYHQIYAIEDQEETSEAFDDLGNPYVDPSNLRQGLGNKYVGPEPRDRVQLSQAAWDRAARAMNGTEPMATTATPEELQAYQYRLARAARELEKQTAELNRRKEAASASSRRRADLSRQSRTSGDSHREARNRARSRLQHIPEAEREHLVQNLDMSFMSIDTRGNIIPKTPEAGYMATHAFILASKPPPGDPRETLYNMAVAGVGAMGTAFVSTPPEGAARQNSPRPATTAAAEGPSGARDTAAQARVDRARQSRRDHRQSPELNDEDMCGLPCFTRRVRKTRVPSGFKLPDNFKKFDGLQDPEDWLVDYLETVKLTGGTRATAMQSIQVHLSGAARSWIKKLTPGSIDSWESFEDVFVKNFRSTTMPFGLKNAGATYQRMMQKCLATQIGKNVQVYIDDVVITSKEGATLIEDLKETFDNLNKFCLKLNPTKCSFGVPAGELLGFLVSARGIEANPDKIQAIITMRKPTKLKEIQQLTGRVAALSRFVARLGEKALPFYALIKQGDKFQWNEEADRAFEDLKRTISTPPILVAPKEKEPLLLYIAATPQVVSTVLVVEREEEGKLHGVQRPVYFISKVLSPSKQRYPQY